MTALAASATASCPGPTTTAGFSSIVPTAESTWAMRFLPAIAWRTLGSELRMRVPSPAASTTTRQVLVAIFSAVISCPYYANWGGFCQPVASAKLKGLSIDQSQRWRHDHNGRDPLPAVGATLVV